MYNKKADHVRQQDMPAKIPSAAYYPPLPPAKRQTFFPNRRKSAKARRLLPPLTKSQSTLTQLEFATPSSSRDILEISSDEEYEEPNSSNKRKRQTKFSARQADQSTMTQFDRGEMRDLFTKRRKVSEIESDEFDIWKDYEPEEWEADLKKRQSERAEAMPCSRGSGGNAENVVEEPEIPESSQLSAEAPPTFKDGAEWRVKDQAATFETPKNVRFRTEVPSSQTPPSVKYSAETRVPDEVTERSPLKERSQNAVTINACHVSPESQNTSMQMLERIKFGSRQIPMKKHKSPSRSPQKIKSSQDAIERCSATTPKARPRRIDTIQDSQVDDAGSQIEPDFLSVFPNQSSNDQISPQEDTISPRGVKVEHTPSPQPQPRQLRRATTIQDSQLDGSDALTLTKTNSSDAQNQTQLAMATENVVAKDGDYEFHGAEEEAETFNPVVKEEASQHYDLPLTYDRSQYFGLQSTYDPAFSALDRDAARFGWTQTQARTVGVEEWEESEESETDCEDLDAGCRTRVAGAAMSPAGRSSQEVVNILEEQHPQSLVKAEPDDAVRDLDATEESDLDEQACGTTLEAQHEVVEVPSSPPAQHAAPYPSQVSTVAATPTVDAPASLDPSEKKRPAAEVVAAPPFSIVSSPPKTCTAPLEMPTSSPLPPPPWSSPRSANVITGEIQSQKSGPNSDASLRPLADFSLPPPPPLSSGRSK